MPAVARALPRRIASFTGAANDLTHAGARIAGRGVDRARDLPVQIAAFSGAAKDLTQAGARVAERGVDRARDLGELLQDRLEHLAHRDRRSSRLPLAVSAVVVVAALGGALLAIPRVRGALRQGWSRVRGRLAGVSRSGDGSAAPALRSPHERQDDLLDEGLEESFPASDPVSVKRIT